MSLEYITQFEEKIKKVITLEQHSQHETKTLRSIVQSIQDSKCLNSKNNEQKFEKMKCECKTLKQKLLETRKQDEAR